MMPNLPSPRLLPMTIATMAALLAFKSVALVRATMSGQSSQGIVVAVAQAASAEHGGGAAKKAPEKGAEKGAEKGTEKAGEKGKGSEKTAEAPATPLTPPITAPEPPPIPDSERALLLELRERRQQLEARGAALDARETMVAAAERRLTERVEELSALQRRLEALEASRTERDEASWQGLVKVYETMKPRDAANIFNELAQSVLLPVLDRMKDAKAAAVLAAMNPDKAREVTAELAQLRSKRNAPLGPITPAATPTAAGLPAGSKAPG